MRARDPIKAEGKRRRDETLQARARPPWGTGVGTASASSQPHFPSSSPLQLSPGAPRGPDGEGGGTSRQGSGTDAARVRELTAERFQRLQAEGQKAVQY